MHPPRGTWMCRVLVLAAVLGQAQSQSVSVGASNSTTGNVNATVHSVEMAVGQQPGEKIIGTVPLIPLMNSSLPHLSGTILDVQADNVASLAEANVALIQCDSTPSANRFVAQAAQFNATAVVLFSQTEPYCTVNGTGDHLYDRVYTVNGTTATANMLASLKTLVNPAYAYIAERDNLTLANGTLPGTSAATSPNNNSSSTDNQNPLGPSPSTAVAMIILYSITGIITALFLIIIITGAVRAHRHPERYGPRNAAGRPRQSRARGMARAMLDTIPIVKFGDRLDQPNKPTDVELAAQAQAQAESAREGHADGPRAESQPETAEIQEIREEAEGSGIAAAAASKASKGPEQDNQGCSICTEDFQVGEDQRVLPCHHCFHPACIDPWLLNVSGTCPLCRIDLRPSPSHSSGDEHTGSEASGEGMAPPLGADQTDAVATRASVRRSIMIGLMGVRPERMSREERIRALRQFRAQQAAAPPTPPQGPEAESSMRSRLRNAFRVRTRRTGEPDPTPTAAAAAAPAVIEPTEGAETHRATDDSSAPPAPQS